MRRLGGLACMLSLAVAAIVLQCGGCPKPGGDPSTQMTLAVTTSGEGTVARNPDGSQYDSGTEVTLTATPVAGWTFDHWEGALSGNTNPATLTLDADMQVMAVFVAEAAPTVWTSTDISTDTTIPPGNYLVSQDMTVRNGATLTIPPGVKLRFAAGTWLNVENDGALHAAGTAGQPIVLTGQTQSPGYWIGLRFQNSNSLNNVLQYVTIQYGGFSSGFVAADLFIGGTSTVDMKNCTLKNSAGWGLWKEAASTLTEAGTAYASNASGDIH